MNSLYPMKLPGDIDVLIDVVQAGFQYPENPEWSLQDEERQSMTEQIQGIKRIWPLIRVMQLFSERVRDAMCGFIYYADDKPIGLINFMRQGRDEWAVANVTVLPEYRRRGIARALVQAALDDLRRRKARIIFLDVIAGNLPAFNLYQEMGFEPYTGSADYIFEPQAPPETGPLPPGYTLTPVEKQSWRTSFALAQRITPANVLKFEAVDERRFRPMPLTSLFMALQGVKNILYALHYQPEPAGAGMRPPASLVGLVDCTYRIRSGGWNRAEIQLDAAHAALSSHLGRLLLSEARRLSPGRKLEVHLKDWQPYLIEAVEGLGGKRRYAFQRMGLFPG